MTCVATGFEKRKIQKTSHIHESRIEMYTILSTAHTIETCELKFPTERSKTHLKGINSTTVVREFRRHKNASSHGVQIKVSYETIEF